MSDSRSPVRGAQRLDEALRRSRSWARPAPVGMRLLAFTLDVIAVALLAAAVGVFAQSWVLALVVALELAVLLGVLEARTGLTVGNACLRLRTTRDDSPFSPGVGASALRAVIHGFGLLIAGIGGWIVVATGWADPRRVGRSIADRAAHTLVVSVPTAREREAQRDMPVVDWSQIPQPVTSAPVTMQASGTPSATTLLAGPAAPVAPAAAGMIAEHSAVMATRAPLRGGAGESTETGKRRGRRPSARAQERAAAAAEAAGEGVARMGGQPAVPGAPAPAAVSAAPGSQMPGMGMGMAAPGMPPAAGVPAPGVSSQPPAMPAQAPVPAAGPGPVAPGPHPGMRPEFAAPAAGPETPAPVPVPEAPAAVDAPAPVQAPVPAPVQAPAPAPEPVQVPAPAPEPAQAPSPAPEPVQAPAPEPIAAPAPAEAPAPAATPDPDPAPPRSRAAARARAAATQAAPPIPVPIPQGPPPGAVTAMPSGGEDTGTGTVREGERLPTGVVPVAAPIGQARPVLARAGELLLVFDSGQQARLPIPVTVNLGRKPDRRGDGDHLVAVIDSEGTVSKNHARIEFQRGSAWITDLGSTNGTRVLVDDTQTDGENIPSGSRVRLEPGSRIRIGNRTFTLSTTTNGEGNA